MKNSTKYPIGVQNFGEIIRGGYVYVDKTAQLRGLIDDGKYYFLSRPRRFGKSLLLSTLAAYFAGDEDLFKGLAIAAQTQEWPRHPVLHLDLSNKRYSKPDDLTERLDLHLKRWESSYGIAEPARSVESRFEEVILRACEREKQQVVILVDEYDKPLLQAMDDEPLREDYRETLQAMYGNLKTCDGYIRFAFITGVAKFGKISVFSSLNNLNDISMDHEYATLCGITEEELDIYFGEGLRSLADYHNISVEDARRQLKRRYDGYLFEENAQSVYNPFSMLNALSKKKFNDYWFSTGTPTFLIEMLKRENVALEDISTDTVSASRLNSLYSLDSDPISVLYQTGYLTINTVDDEGNYSLRFPNEEVERAFLKELLPFYTLKGNSRSDVLLNRMVDHIKKGKPEDFLEELQALLADIPYEQGRPGEIYFRNLLFAIFRLVGFSCEVEHQVAGGRLDVLIKTRQYIYVLELKVDQSADAALRQIEEKGYAAPYATDSRRLFKIGVNCSGADKRIDEWRIATA